MITKRVLKKTIIGAAVALMACMSTGAMAEKRWVWVADVVPSGYLTDTPWQGFHGVCEYPVWLTAGTAWPITYNGNYKVELVEGYGYIALTCYGSDPVNGRDHYRPTFSCPYDVKVGRVSGQFDIERPDGCYEWKEVEPEQCEDFPTQPSICEGQDKHHPDYFEGAYPLGTVACSGKKLAPCFWKDQMPENITNCAAKKIVYQCAIEHKNAHISNYKELQVGECKKPANDFPYEMMMSQNEKAWHLEERYPHTVELTCLDNNISQCKGDTDCMDQVKSRRDTVQNNKNYHEREANKPGQEPDVIKAHFGGILLPQSLINRFTS